MLTSPGAWKVTARIVWSHHAVGCAGVRFRATVLALFVAAALVATASAASHTKAIIYHAFTASGQPAFHVSKTQNGKCFASSSETNRNDAWRCLTGNFLHDPCFSSSAAPGIVLCPDHPWGSSGIEIRLTKALSGGHTKKPSTKGLPWAMQTTSGLKCVFQGMGPFVSHTVFADYACQGGTWLWNKPNRGSQPWTIKAGGKMPSLTVQVKKAWF
jgi:hypothetical protein